MIRSKQNGMADLKQTKNCPKGGNTACNVGNHIGNSTSLLDKYCYWAYQTLKEETN